MRVLLDTSCWIELLGGSERADLYEPALKADRLLVPGIVRYEVARYLLVHADEARRKSYLARSAGIKGDWRDDKWSANNLARELLW
jgi:predicted nucleic acid-binding protein